MVDFYGKLVGKYTKSPMDPSWENDEANLEFEFFSCLRLLNQHTELEHTPKKPLPTGYEGIPFIVGDRGIVWCVFWGCVVISLDHENYNHIG